jgi:hypothetical protein
VVGGADLGLFSVSLLLRGTFCLPFRMDVSGKNITGKPLKPWFKHDSTYKDVGMIGTLRIALVGAFLYVAFCVLVRLAAIGLARYKGSVGIDLSRPMLFLLSLSMWIFAFSVAYWI